MAGQPPYFESPVEKQIREAQERGDFDDLPGAGRPLDLGDLNDPDWWVKRLAKRERLDLGGALPGALGLRKEASGFPGSLADVRREEQVREILDDFNQRVLADRLRPAVGRLPPAIAKTVDIDDLVRQWVQLRERITAEAQEQAEAMARARAAEEASERAARRDRSWWRSLRRR
ncbi:hypothetical protein BA895_01935 [Humibacillus sp. DSM 29435]|uniref:DnaJ family domain-containing protein n=1 Tax=Humibacillus sp. DSM 29435 TaxID=1869167 RepID=UPI0008724923|nr:DUF1992 domain-containing protein [Humibacillus sp. DSM 29435]OFE18938.1 hypothetical protein BA895_01935 [Humibacillus sp. DSM 29435]